MIVVVEVAAAVLLLLTAGCFSMDGSGTNVVVFMIGGGGNGEFVAAPRIIVADEAKTLEADMTSAAAMALDGGGLDDALMFLLKTRRSIGGENFRLLIRKCGVYSL